MEFCCSQYITHALTHSHRPVIFEPVRRIFTFAAYYSKSHGYLVDFFMFYLCLPILPGKTLLSIVGSLACTPQCSVHEGTSVFRLIRKTSTWTHHLGKKQGGGNCCPTWIRTRNLSLPRQVHLPLGHPLLFEFKFVRFWKKTSGFEPSSYIQAKVCTVTLAIQQQRIFMKLPNLVFILVNKKCSWGTCDSDSR